MKFIYNISLFKEKKKFKFTINNYSTSNNNIVLSYTNIVSKN